MSLDRVLLVLAFAGVVVLLYLLMLKGWRSRLRRQSDLPAPPAPPAEPGTVVVPATTGLYVGTTAAENWLDRIAVHDLAHRAAGRMLLDSNGIHVEREGAAELFVPYSAVERASVGDAHAGKFVGKGGLVLVDWRLGTTLVTSAFRADDHAAHRRLVDAISAHAPVQEAST